ncbi:MAG: 5-bromo-4-chloroindolyl phosphate hydrolysis protein [Anaerocolumna sp.]|nr:5-bromo-4-chloroindolyl phosphate hydrolysis protein [Anaerocolumna sp.]
MVSQLVISIGGSGGITMSRRDFIDLGDEIKDIVQNAVNSSNFHQLNKDISNTVKGALDEVRDSLHYGAYKNIHRNFDDSMKGDRSKENNNRQSGQEQNYRTGKGYDSNTGTGYKRKQQYQAYKSSTVSNQTSAVTPKQKQKYPQIPVGKVASILYTVFGSIGMSLFGLGAFVLALVGQLSGKLNFFGTIALSLLPFFFISCILSARGSALRKRLQRFRRYTDLFNGMPYYSINDLSASLGLKRVFVLKELRKMISIGMFPEGRFDEQETCIMLNKESFRQYQELKNNVSMQEITNTKKDSSVDGQATSANTTINSEIRNAIEAGRLCIQQIRDANDAIPGEEISKKLDRLEQVMGKIFHYIEQHPSQLTDIQKFMDYYMPTTLKLVNAYKEFDKLSVQGDNISTAKNEIEETLNTINYAFENLLDSLYEDVTMDVSSDISVLETLLAQEGLTRKDFASNK